jgi:hypothetical protein
LTPTPSGRCPFEYWHKPETERVIFRKWKDTGDVIAFFPDQRDRQYIGSYMHVGQHSNATYPHSGTVAAKPGEYADLEHELQSIGYNLRVVRHA